MTDIPKPLTADFSYVGFNASGDAVAVCVDNPRFQKDTAKTVASWIRMGRTVSRLEHHAACALLENTLAKRNG